MKSQIRSLQNFILLSIFVIFIFIFGLIFFSIYTTKNKTELMEMKNRYEFYRLTSILNFVYFKCISEHTACVDLYSIKAFNETYKNDNNFREAINSILGPANITLYYPITGQNIKSLLIYSYDINKKIKTKRRFLIPVVVHDLVKGELVPGYLNITLIS